MTERDDKSRDADLTEQDKLGERRKGQVGLSRHLAFAVTRGIDIVPKRKAFAVGKLGRKLVRCEHNFTRHAGTCICRRRPCSYCGSLALFRAQDPPSAPERKSSAVYFPARRGAVLRAIDTQFARGDFSVEAVGVQLGITGRQIHRLLEETTKTFSEHLLERRLVRAHELLTSPSTSGKRIADIAYESGFADVTHFSYAFRRRFGDSPRGVRVRAERGRTMAVLRRSLDR
ncbi:MAG: helix-turn-helix transcriptional regulator [Alphaproteobacteria bacterium]|nr:helix-turn-helix transcriptional regulator [Alphaproteobacteria bacterium]